VLTDSLKSELYQEVEGPLRRSDLRATDEPRAIVAVEDPLIVRRVAAGLEALSCPYSICEPCVSALSAGPGGAVYYLGSRVASDLPRFPGPTIVILSGARLTDEAVLKLQGRRMSTLHVDGLTPTSLLRAMVCARCDSEIENIARQLGRMGKLERVPQAVITAFLEDPTGSMRIHDLRRALAPLSRESAQALVRAAGFPRAEHLFTALRCAAWLLLMREGVNRKTIEQYLGIIDRTSFRRACKRAGVPAIHANLRSEAFGA
jgi:hypothetical protein